MVDDVQGLEAAVGLRSLVLTFNELTSMEGLTPLTRLTCLDLSFNAITRIQALKVNPPPPPHPLPPPQPPALLPQQTAVCALHMLYLLAIPVVSFVHAF